MKPTSTSTRPASAATAWPPSACSPPAASRTEEIDVSGDHARRAWLVEATGQRTVPQIFIGGESIGGYDELAALDRSGELAAKMGCRAGLRQSPARRPGAATSRSATEQRATRSAPPPALAELGHHEDALRAHRLGLLARVLVEHRHEEAALVARVAQAPLAGVAR